MRAGPGAFSTKRSADLSPAVMAGDEYITANRALDRDLDRGIAHTFEVLAVPELDPTVIDQTVGVPKAWLRARVVHTYGQEKREDDDHAHRRVLPILHLLVGILRLARRRSKFLPAPLGRDQEPGEAHGLKAA
jgi:hypothetical protein